jgi:hypothetical protein
LLLLLLLLLSYCFLQLPPAGTKPSPAARLLLFTHGKSCCSTAWNDVSCSLLAFFSLHFLSAAASSWRQAVP